MVWNEELGKEIPMGWRIKSFAEFVSLSQGQVINAKTRHIIRDKGLPLLRITDLINDTQNIFIDESVNQKNIASEEDIIYTRTGQVGLVFRNKVGVVYNNCFKVIPIDESVSKEYIYWFLKQKTTYRTMVELASSSAQSDLTHKAFFSVFLFMPEESIQQAFSEKTILIEKSIRSHYLQNKSLKKLRTALLSRISKVETPVKDRTI